MMATKQPEKEIHRCAGTVWKDFHHCRCQVNASLEHDGEWWCKTHHPPTVKAKLEAKSAKWQEQWAAERKAAQEKRHAEEEKARKAAAYDRLMDRIFGKKEYETLCVADIRAALEGKQ